MRERFESERAFLNAREVLANLHLNVKLIRRRRRLLATKGWEAQPRAPAGQTDRRSGRPTGGPPGVRAGTHHVARSVRASGNYRDATEFGNRVHIQIAQRVNAYEDPNFTAELLLNPKREPLNPRAKGNVRLDLLENIEASKTVCVYDDKTGREDLSMARAQQRADSVQRNYPFTRRIIMIQVRPEP